MATYKEIYNRILSSKTKKDSNGVKPQEKIVTTHTLHTFKEVYNKILQKKFEEMETKFVEKEAGKVLSDRNFTSEYENKLQNLDPYAQPNKIESVTVTNSDFEPVEGVLEVDPYTQTETKSLVIDLTEMMSNYKLRTDEEEGCYLLDENNNQVKVSDVQVMNTNELSEAFTSGFEIERP